MQPDDLSFVAVGPFKTGTTWIDTYLRFHEGVALPQRVKETFYFDKYFNRGFEWYASHFEGLLEGSTAGEIGPSYFQSKAATQRIFDTNPDCRILVTMREPVSRAVSHYLMMVRNGVVGRDVSIREAVQKHNVLLASSTYGTNLARWVAMFGQARVGVILFDELKRDVHHFAHLVCQALGIEDLPVPEELTGRVHGRREPVNYGISKVASRITQFLRHHQLHSLVNLAKKAGARDVVFTSKRGEYAPEPGDLQFVFERLVDDSLALETEFGLDISGWKETWKKKGFIGDSGTRDVR